MSDHAIYSPSSCYRNLSCVGSIALLQMLNIEAKPSEYAKEGTLAHEWIEKALTTIHGEQHFDFTQIPDEEMRGHVTEYCAFIGELNKQFRKSCKGVRYHIEKRVKYDEYLWGTADYVLTGIHKKTNLPEAVICDFKYGKGVEVSAEENEQLLCYALCAQKTLGMAFSKVHCFIFQPRTPGKEFNRWTVDQSVLNGAELSIIRNKRDCMELVGKPLSVIEEKLVAGDHCRFCAAKMHCKAYKADLNSTQLKILDEVPEIPVSTELSLEQKLEIFKRRKMIKRFIDDIGAELLTLATSGADVPGYKVVEGQRRRGWKKDQVEKIGSRLVELGVDDPYKKSLIGIGEVEKQIGKGKIDDLTELSKVSYQLVPEDDKRQAVQITGIEDLGEIEFAE